MARVLPKPVRLEEDKDEEKEERGEEKPSAGQAMVKRPLRSTMSGMARRENLDRFLTITYTDDEEYQYQKVLIAGMSKSGRTHFALTWPDPLIVNSDKGLEAYKDVHVPMITLKRSDKVPVSEVLMKLIETMRDREGDFRKWFPKTLIVDQATSICDLMEEEVKIYSPPSQKGEERGESLFLADYKVIQQRFLRFMDALRDLPCHVVMITNTTFEKDPMLEGLYESPAVTGQKLSPQVPTYFGEVYYLKYSEKVGKYVAIIRPNSRFPYAGTRHDNLRDGLKDGFMEDPSYEKFAQFYYAKKRKK